MYHFVNSNLCVCCLLYKNVRLLRQEIYLVHFCAYYNALHNSR